ncbi:MAG: undecaprenyl-diphosphate phosphatase [Desulfonatronovibrionaceae bacterium]
MHVFIIAVIMGIVEGLTEFLPVSSTGHLIIVGHLLGFTGPQASTFEVVIQLGAILAVVVMYWPTFLGLIRPQEKRRFSGIYGLWLLFLTSLPASVLGLLTHSLIKDLLFNPVSVAWALGVGALAILVVERRKTPPKMASLDEIDSKTALYIGCFQCLALWPGFSRSAATIMGGMILGARRKLSAEYSFIAAVPIMIAASGFDLSGSWSEMTRTDFVTLVIGFVVSFASAWLAVKGFIALLSAATLRPFAWYRLALAPFVLLLWPE